MLVPFHNHQFSLYDGERRDDMVESIRKNGVMTPIVCRPNPDGSDTYEILIGHNRWNCSKIAGFETIPAIIKEQLTEDEAQTLKEIGQLPPKVRATIPSVMITPSNTRQFRDVHW